MCGIYIEQYTFPLGLVTIVTFLNYGTFPTTLSCLLPKHAVGLPCTPMLKVTADFIMTLLLLSISAFLKDQNQQIFIIILSL